MASAIGTGSSITFASYTFIATNISRSSVSRPAIRSSHLGTTTWDTFLPGKLSNPGTVQVDVHLDVTAISQYEQMITATSATTLTLTLGLDGNTSQSTKANITASAFVTDIEQAFPLEDMMTGSITFQLSGTPTPANQTT